MIESIIEHVYPDPKAGRTLPIAQGEGRAAAGLARKGIVTIEGESEVRSMTFTSLGEAVYNECRGDRAPW
ncbi:hypothetical protein ACVCH0_01045 [Burkholderia glumae]|uniref:hypothetical protein n=1 Tax=Burkholderia glumae TaxID=337 RepID=UPI002150C29D|nr:hypothetical protein [Burkholderia glumae]